MTRKDHWWETRIFVIVAALLAAVPLLRPTIPPLVDLPGHMGRYRVQLSIDQYPWLSEWYNFNWQLIGNLGFDLLIIPLAPVFGLELAVKLLVICIPVLTVTGLLWIAREVHGRIPATALFALPLAYNFPFHFGFVNFSLSMAVALNLFALWLRLARLNRLGLRAAIFVPASCLLWLCHTFGWGFLGVLAFSAEMIRQHDRLPQDYATLGQRARHWLAAWTRAGLNCLPLALPILMMIAWRSGSNVGGETGDWFNWRAKIGWITMVLRDRWQAFDIASTAVLYLILFKGVRDPNIEYSRNLVLSALFLLAVFLLLPRIVFGSAYADMRLAPFMIAIALVGLRPKRGLSIERAATVAALGLAFFVVRIGSNTASFWLYADSYDRQLKALDHIPVGARLVSFVGETCNNQWFMSRLQHVPAIALERKLAYTNDQWSMAGAQLLTVRHRLKGFAHDPSQLVTHEQCPREWWRPLKRSLVLFPRHTFDYVWIMIPPPYPRGLEAGLKPLWRDPETGSGLFEVIHDQPGPQVRREELIPPPRRAETES
ncbi:hypothetical protein [Sphingomonas sp.]|uniref:hypothetical protein n=1 Tax=Sphingomonas sp. TaxID=28214 RepID=UPI001E140E06|nr:hypothetical protein [Sphingomonas sp.]MBX9797340.1 hypothetical protein [Sphingomonas sp.]